MYESFGAVVDHAQGTVEFRLFFPDRARDPSQYVRGGLPNIAQIRVIGTFQSRIGGNDWDIGSGLVMARSAHPNGWLYTANITQRLEADFYEYKYYVTFNNTTTRYCSDPCTKYGGSYGTDNSGFVVAGNFTNITPLPRRSAYSDLIVYELMIDDFTAEYLAGRAPIDAVADKLDHLQNLGVNAIEFMPWTAWPGSGFNWGYEPSQFFSVSYRYVNDPASPADKLVKLKTLIDQLHRRNMHVIMDGVFNHVQGGRDPNHGFPYLWLYENPSESPYIGPFAGGGFFDDFDYANGCTEQFIRDICLYWINVFNIDGIRFDYTLGFFRPNDPGVGITRLITDLGRQLESDGNRGLVFMIEHLTDNRYQAIDDTNQICASGCWFDPFMYKAFDYSRNGRIDGDVLRVLNSSLDFASGKGPVTYIENHDHSYIVAEAGGRDRWYATQPSAIALLTSAGPVLIRNGQEFGEDYALPESGSGRVVPRPLRWNTYGNDGIGTRLFAIYKKLIGIRNTYSALRSPNFFPYPQNHPDGYGAFLGRGVVVFHRWGPSAAGATEKFIIIINYSMWDQYIDIPFSNNGRWADLLNDNEVMVDNYRLQNQRINSNWGRIYLYRG